MTSETFTFKSMDGVDIFVYKWVPDGSIKGAVQIAHGVSEHAGRYEHFATKLVREGYIVYANDHRGHGRTAKTVKNLTYLGNDGWNSMVRDAYDLTCIIKKNHPYTPLFFFGHSMGSFVLRQYLYQYPNEINGATLAGTGSVDKILLNAGILIAKRLIDKDGAKKRSYYLNRLAFGSFNIRITNRKTIFDWISRDEDVVKKFIHDPLCGIPCTNNFFYELLSGIKEIQRTNNTDSIPKSTPILLVSGDKDPVGHWGKDALSLAKQYEETGIKDIQCKLYKDCRHELINEINRDEVIEDIIRWINSHIN